MARRPDLYSPFSDRLGAVLVRPVHGFGRLVLDLEITGREHVPLRGPTIFAANHLSHIDPPVVSLAAGANVRYLALAELFGRSRIFDYLTLFFGAIPMSRDRPPLGALKTALAHLRAGGLLGVFPEGRRVAYWGENDSKRGAAWLSLRTGAPVVPVAIGGTEGTMSVTEPGIKRAPVRVWVEAPLWPDDYLDRVDPLGAMMEDWRRALDRHLGPWFADWDRTVLISRSPDDV